MSRGNYEALMEAVRLRESTNDYTIKNKYGFAGAYQMGELALIDAGFYKKDGTTKNDWRGEWTQKAKDMGIDSIDDFLESADGQDLAVQAYWQKAWGYIRAAGLDKYIGQTINGVTITESALIGGYHLVGMGYTDKYGIRHPGLKDYITSGGKTNPTDANKTKVSEYINLFNDYDVPFKKGVGIKRRPKKGSSSNVVLDPTKQQVTTATTTRSPIGLDLDGDGVETTALADGAHFDHDANGFAEQTGWVSSDDGLLVMDRDGNGNIDNGTELFGDSTPIPDGAGGTRNAVDGFEALSAQDTNSDGVVDSNDANFANLRIWQDLNQDGVSSEDELKELKFELIAA